MLVWEPKKVPVINDKQFNSDDQNAKQNKKQNRETTTSSTNMNMNMNMKIIALLTVTASPIILFGVSVQGFTLEISSSHIEARARATRRRRLDYRRHPFLVGSSSSSFRKSNSKSGGGTTCTTTTVSNSNNSFRLYDASGTTSTTTTTSTTATGTTSSDEEEIHPAVVGWPEKYSGDNKSGGGTFHVGPRKLSDTFDVVRRDEETQQLFKALDVQNWPTWTTSDKPKWQVGNVVADKVMPYGELSYMISGRLQITYRSDAAAAPAPGGGGGSITTTSTTTEIIGPGEFVTFPKDFCATWEVLEELTWYYYLY